MARVLPMPRGGDVDAIRVQKTLSDIPRAAPLDHALTPNEGHRLLGKFIQLAAFMGRPTVWRLEYMVDHYLGTTPPGVTSMAEYIALREREHNAPV